MEIKNIRSEQLTEIKRDKKVTQKKDFSQSFGDAKDRRSNEQFKEMIKQIHTKGNKLIISKSYADVRAYKRMIKEYLKEVLNHMYKVKNNTSFWQTQYFITVDLIDEKLDDLTNELLNNELENIAIAATIDEIQGLIVDIYR
ncbi:MAG: YaaR family protein [Sarcina sp.]